MKGKTVVATGATSGIGEAAVLALARMRARIVLVARDQRRAEATLNALEARAPRLGHSAHLADLSSMAETRRVGLAIAASESWNGVLINNAGAMFSVRRLTPEGLERTFALNHMAYFMLTVALGDRLAASTPARIVSTTSAAHLGASLDFLSTCREPKDTALQGLRALKTRQYPFYPRDRPPSCIADADPITLTLRRAPALVRPRRDARPSPAPPAVRPR
jgi:NAD(P)-dependent dehydrogenase (short-subunit alcohol dehydrogenase family)